MNSTIVDEGTFLFIEVFQLTEEEGKTELEQNITILPLMRHGSNRAGPMDRYEHHQKRSNLTSCASGQKDPPSAMKPSWPKQLNLNQLNRLESMANLQEMEKRGGHAEPHPGNITAKNQTVRDFMG